MKIIKATGFAKKMWMKDGKVDMIELKETAEIVFAVILTGAALMAGGTAASEIGKAVSGTGGNAILGAIEGTLSGIKSAEIIQIVKSVGPKIAGA